MTKYIYALLIVLTTGAAIGQTCTQRLSTAEADYKLGKLTQIPLKLEKCLGEKGSFTKEEEVRALKLLTLVYLFTDDEQKAEEYMIRLLHKDPEHRIDREVDPAEFEYLHRQFQSKPIYRVSVKGGINFSNLDVIREYAVNDNLPAFYNGVTKDGQDSYNYQGEEFVPIDGGRTGFTLELLFEKHIKNGIELGFGVSARRSRYNKTTYINSENFSSATHGQWYGRVPVLVRYTHWYNNRDRKFLPMGFLGISPEYLLASDYAITKTGGTQYTLSRGSDPLEFDLVNRFNLSWFGGIGIKYRIKTHFLSVEARYDAALKTYINGENRYNNHEAAIETITVESDQRLRFWTFSLAYTRSIYHPKKLK